jgi:lipopolysaccharide biosynthesis regulator YciM
VLSGDFDTRGFQREARQRRATSGIYLGELAAAQPQRKASTALALARRAVDVSPGNYHAQVSLGRLLSRERHHDEALAILDRVVQTSERGLTYVVDYGNALVLAGRIAEARLIVDEAMSRTSDVAHLHAWAAHICWLNNEKTKARRLIRRAVMLDPGNTPYLRALIDYYFGAPLSTGHRGVRTTPWLRFVRWVMKEPLKPNAGERPMRSFSLRGRDGPASGGAS